MGKRRKSGRKSEHFRGPENAETAAARAEIDPRVGGKWAESRISGNLSIVGLQDRLLGLGLCGWPLAVCFAQIGAVWLALIYVAIVAQRKSVCPSFSRPGGAAWSLAWLRWYAGAYRYAVWFWPLMRDWAVRVVRGGTAHQDAVPPAGIGQGFVSGEAMGEVQMEAIGGSAWSWVGRRLRASEQDCERLSVLLLSNGVE